jgi:hypothetical protein
MVDVTDGPDVQVRFRSLKFLFGHGSTPSTVSQRQMSANKCRIDRVRSFGCGATYLVEAKSRW